MIYSGNNSHQKKNHFHVQQCFTFDIKIKMYFKMHTKTFHIRHQKKKKKLNKNIDSILCVGCIFLLEYFVVT